MWGSSTVPRGNIGMTATMSSSIRAGTVAELACPPGPATRSGRVQMRVDGKVALVTGASRGIGEAIVRALLEAGAQGVVITGRRAETLEPLAADLGDRVLAVVGNVGDEEHATAAV